MRILAATLSILAGCVFAACGDDDPEPPPEPTGQEAAADPAGEQERSDSEPDRPDPRPGTRLVVADSQFGPMLFDSNRQAIYLFDREAGSKPRCYGDCAAAWPPVLTKGRPVAGAGARVELIGTTRRRDGSLQVTYAGQPLYYYAHEGPNEVLCHNVSEFGGLWLVLGADGDALA